MVDCGTRYVHAVCVCVGGWVGEVRTAVWDRTCRVSSERLHLHAPLALDERLHALPGFRSAISNTWRVQTEISPNHAAFSLHRRTCSAYAVRTLLPTPYRTVQSVESSTSSALTLLLNADRSAIYMKPWCTSIHTAQRKHEGMRIQYVQSQVRTGGMHEIGRAHV